MALTDEGTGFNVSMPVAPAYGGGNGFGNGFGGDWFAWLIIAMLLGNGGFGMGGFGGWGGMMGMGFDFPWLLAGQQNISNNTNDGFRSAQLSDAVTSVRDGISSLSTQLCGFCGDMQMSLANGFAGTTAAITGAQNALAQQMYSNELANLNRSFAEQTASTAGFNGVQSSLCDIRYGNANNTRDILTALTAGVQSIKDQLCQDKIDAKNDEIAQLRQEVLYARGQASQDVQTARILAGQVGETDAIYNRLSQCPVGTIPVFGNQPIWTCASNVANNCGCGCGCNG